MSLISPAEALLCITMRKLHLKVSYCIVLACAVCFYLNSNINEEVTELNYAGHEWYNYWLKLFHLIYTNNRCSFLSYNSYIIYINTLKYYYIQGLYGTLTTYMLVRTHERKNYGE
jgi:hypothetical protein